MLNSQKMGAFIKANRRKNNWSREQFADEISIRSNDTITAPAIAQWESGQTVPDVNHAIIIAHLFDVSIDDLIEGEISERVDFKTIYPTSIPNYYMSKPEINRFEENKKIRARFNILIKKYVEDTLTRLEEKELEFLLNNFFVLSNDVKKDFDEKSTNSFIIKSLALNKDMYYKKAPTKEKIWLIKRLMMPISELLTSYSILCEAITNDYKEILAVFDELDFWEKDLIFSLIQKIDPINKSFGFGSKPLVRFKKNHGREFDFEKECKTIIRYFIEHGACLNEYYLNFKKTKYENERNIDNLENIYQEIRKPLKVSHRDEQGHLTYYYVKNTYKNRFILHRYEYLLGELDYTFDELYDLYKNNEEPPLEYILKLAKVENIDLNKYKKYWMEDLKISPSGYKLTEWKKYKGEDAKYLKYEKEINVLLANLNKGNKTSIKETIIEYGGSNENEMLLARYSWNVDLPYPLLKRCRNKSLTMELLDNLDNLTLSEIRVKYFPISDGGDENE